jgi:hypothetical protein
VPSGFQADVPGEYLSERAADGGVVLCVFYDHKV